MSARYRLRMFFDPGSGVLAWAGNKETEARFGYPVETASLGLPAALEADVEQLIADYDASFDWDDPGNVKPGDAEIEARMLARLDELAERVRAAVGPDIEVVVQQRG